MTAFVMKAAGVPVGQYRAKFLGYESSVHESYGDRVLFTWEIVDGEHVDATVTRYTSARMTPKSALAKIASGLAGHKLEPGDSFAPDDHVGTEYLVIVEETDSGATRVGTCIKA